MLKVDDQAEQERQAAVIRAEGEGEAATIISRALDKAGEGLVQIRRIEASRDIAATLVSHIHALWNDADNTSSRAEVETSRICPQVDRVSSSMYLLSSCNRTRSQMYYHYYFLSRAYLEAIYIVKAYSVHPISHVVRVYVFVGNFVKGQSAGVY